MNLNVQLYAYVFRSAHWYESRVVFAENPDEAWLLLELTWESRGSSRHKFIREQWELQDAARVEKSTVLYFPDH